MQFDDRTYFGIPAITVEYSRMKVENLSFSVGWLAVDSPESPRAPGWGGAQEGSRYSGASPSAFICSWISRCQAVL